ncbi:MAG: hypothetical protein ACRDYD_13655 [Acidimicrobiales bacterium]
MSLLGSGLRTLTSAPWRRAPLLVWRHPSVAVAVTVTAAILALSVSALPLYLSSGGSAATALEVAQRCPSELGATVVADGPVAPRALAARSADAARLVSADLRSSGAPPGALAGAVTTVTLLSTRGALALVGPRSGAHPLQIQLLDRSDQLAHVSAVSSAGGVGVWIPDDAAAALGARSGETLTLEPVGSTGARAGAPVPLRVAGVYRSLEGRTLPRFWCDGQAFFGTPDDNFPPPPVVLAGPAALAGILRAVSGSSLTFEWQRSLRQGGTTLPQARATEAALRRLARQLPAPAPGPGGRRPEAPPPGSMSASPPQQLPFVVDHAAAVRGALGSGTLPVSVAGGLVALLLVGAAASYWVDQRRVELDLLHARGVGPAALGCKAALELGAPVILGAGGGWAVAVAAVTRLGPSHLVSTWSLLAGLALAGAAAGAAIALVAVVAGLRARGRGARPLGAGHSRWAVVPLELVLVGLAGWVWSGLQTVGLEAGATSAPGVSAGFLAFPLLFLAGLVALCGRALVVALPALRRSSSAWSVPLWLSARRLAGAPRVSALLLASVAAATGILVYAAALTRSERATLHAKADVFVGSDVSADLVGRPPVPPALAGRATEVWRSPNAQVGNVAVDLVAVDPATFGRAAFWDPSFASRSLEGLLAGLAHAAPGTFPVVVANGSVPAGQPVTFTYGAQRLGQAKLDVVASVADFPGENGTVPLVVTTQAALAPLHLNPLVQLWSRGTQEVVLSELARAGVVAPVVISAAGALDLTSFAAVAWTFAYLQALGVLVGVIAVGGLLLYLEARQRSRALAYGLARRMGLSRTGHMASLACELGSLVGLGAVAGGALGWAAVELVDRHLNPLPSLPPVPLVEVPGTVLEVAAAVTVAVAALATAWAQHLSDRARPSALLRLDA